MTRLLCAVLAACVLLFAVQRASALDEVCTDEVDPGAPYESDAFSVGCYKDDSEYASVSCSTSNAGEDVSCEYTVSDPGDFCAVSISCNIYFLNDDDEVVDHVYVEEGSTAEGTASWARAQIVCGCLEWW